jgi:hypothetical protein
MLLTSFASYLRLRVLVLVESLMSSASDNKTPFLLPKAENGRSIDVESWKDYVLHDSSVGSCIITTVTHYKCAKRAEHEFLVVGMELKLKGSGTKRSAYLLTERGTRDITAPSSPISNSIPSTPAINTSSKVLSFKPVLADDRVWVPCNGGKAHLDDHLLKNYGASNVGPRIVCTLSWLDEPCMSITQLAVLLHTVNQHHELYILNTHCCYWYAQTIAEVIHLHFNAEEEKGPAYDNRGMYGPVKPNLEDAVDKVIPVYDEEWAEVCKMLAKRAVNCIDSF